MFINAMKKFCFEFNNYKQTFKLWSLSKTTLAPILFTRIMKSEFSALI